MRLAFFADYRVELNLLRPSISGAYGGSEVGAMVGGMVGPPVIGNIVGGLVGEVVGADAVSKCGLDDKAKKVGQTVLSA